MKKREVLLILTTVLALLLAAVTFQRAQKEKDLRKETQTILKQERSAKLTILKDSNQAQAPVQVASESNIRILLGDDPTIKDLNIKLSTVQSYLKVLMHSKGSVYDSVNVETFIKDSIRYEVRKYDPSNKYLKLSCIDSGLTVRCDYTYLIALKAIIHNERFKLLKPRTWLSKNRHTFATVVADDPNAVIDTVRAVIRRD